MIINPWPFVMVFGSDKLNFDCRVFSRRQLLAVALCGFFSATVCAQSTTESDCLFSWAETKYPQFFAPAGATSTTYSPYYYRYYSGTGNYLATSSTDNHIWMLGRDTGSKLLDVGSSADYLTTAACPVPLMSAREEPTAVKDNASVYSVEDTTKVISATIKTIDGTYTFAQVNSDLDPNDDFKPEVDAHFVADNYPEDGLATNAKLRMRGNTSRLAVQKSYRLKLNSGRPLWRGETTLQLNKQPWDLTRVRNKLAFDLFREIPHLPSLRTQFMHLTVNGQDYGLFTHVEKWGKEYLSNRGLKTDGNIYKAAEFNFNSSTSLALDSKAYPANLTAFELVLELENDNKNHQLLADMLTAVNDEGQAFEPVFQKYFDKNNYLTWLAVNILTGNRDTKDQNFGLYQPKESTIFYFMPWDYDGSFGWEDQPDVAAENNVYSSWQLGLSNWWESPLFRRFISDPVHLRELNSVVDDIYSNYLTEAKIKAKLDAYKPLVESLITKSPDLDNLPTVSSSRAVEWSNEYDRLPKVVKKNYETYKASIEKPMPFWQSATAVADQLQISWDKSVDLQGDQVLYSIRVADNPSLLNPIYSRDNESGLSISIPKPAKGTYYMQVTARDSKMNSQKAFNRYDQGKTAYFGVSQFTVN